MQLFKRSTATLAFDDGTVVSAAAMADVGQQRAAHLANTGWQRGDRLALHLPNGFEYIAWLLACAAGGYVAVSVNTRYSDDEADHLIGRSGARRPPTVAELSAVCDSRSHDTGGESDGFVVFTTSGTTGPPKMVLHRQAPTVRHAYDVAERTELTSGDRVLVVMPLCGTFGLTSLMAAIAADTQVWVTDYERRHTARLVADVGITTLNGSDDLFHRLLEDGADMSSIRLGGYARFNSSLDGLVARADAVGATLVGLYGMSEVQALFSMRDPSASIAEREKAGGPVTSVDAAYRVVDGELQLRGPSMFAGYLQEGGEAIDEDLTDRAFDDGWFCTGDLAAPEGPRSFQYLARRGDALRLGGFLVNPDEIVAVLQEQDGVDAAQVVAVDRPEGTRPVAFVIATGEVDEAHLISACAQRLARYKVPIRVIRLDDFPATDGPNGTKVRLTELRQAATDILGGKS